MNLCLLSKGAVHSLAVAGAAASVAVLAACGGQATPQSGPPAVPAPSASDVTPSTTMPDPTGAEAPPAAPVAANAVDIVNFAFAAPGITVKVGTTVTWTNKDEDPHTVTGASFNSPTMTTGAMFAYTFTAPGSFDYLCTIHPFMHGTVVVTP